MNYLKLGSQLRIIRERKGLSYYQIFEVTRIQPSILKEIEEGSSKINSVFLKSFIKTYAEFLGLDFEKLKIDLAKKNQEEHKEKNKVSENSKKIKKTNIRFKNRVKSIFLIVILLVIIPILFFQVSKKEQDESIKNLNNDNLVKNETQQEESQLQTDEFQNQESILDHQISLEKIKKSVFKHELLIQSDISLSLYFKVDNHFTRSKILDPAVWYYIKGKESIYLRLDDKPKDIQLFYNGNSVELSSDDFFERKFE
ncbi:MAG: helix-turn-helix domain-containing protein [Bdellovibrionaceae bacterium]|nr:helix-turn-helix domain-containing protein [Pseudobdellovibrionaceae bacterium]